MNFTYIRAAFESGDLASAFKHLAALAPEQMLNEIQVLQAQWNIWKQEAQQGLYPPREERNRILYATLSLVSALESSQNTGATARRARELQMIETALAQGYGKQAEWRKKGKAELFLHWLRQKSPIDYQKILRDESQAGHVLDFAGMLDALELEGFIKSFSLNTTVAELKAYLLQENETNTLCFTSWITNRPLCDLRASALEPLIVQYENLYARNLKIGLGSGLLGAAGALVLHDSMAQAITQVSAMSLEDLSKGVEVLAPGSYRDNHDDLDELDDLDDDDDDDFFDDDDD